MRDPAIAGGGGIRQARGVKVLFLAGLLAVLPALAETAESGPVLLAREGKALLPVVVAPDAGEIARTAAEELARYLGKISGAAFEVKTGDAAAGPAIFLGTPDRFPVPGRERDLELRDSRDGVEAFVIHPEAKTGSLYLVGATELGASHAAFRFLEKLGCRWFFPGEAWEVVPRSGTIAADFAEADRPVMLSRRVWWGYGFYEGAKGRIRTDYDAWARRNRMAESFRIQAGHAWQAIIAENRAEFDAHPEYYALVKGERRGPQMCLSQPGVRRLAREFALRKLERFPDHDMVSMEPSDGFNQCECEKCAALGSVSERAFGLTNEVARAVAEKFPGKMVGMLAYSDHCEPPSFELEPNVYVQSTAGFVHGRYTFDELLDLWPKKTRNFGVYEYFSVWPWDFDQLPGGKANDIAMLTERIRRYAAAGATSISAESGDNWGLHGRGYYVALRLMWNPDTDVDALLADFYEKAFGPAAVPVRRYYERFDRGGRPLMSEHLLGLGFRDLDEATGLARDEPEVLARLDLLKQYLHYVRVRWDLDRLPKDDPARKALTLDGLTWCHRTRYTHMNHWAAMWQGWSKQAAEEFDEPGWSHRYRESPQPWAVDSPVSPAETERVFRADLERFQPLEIVDREFAGELVMANLPDPDPKIVRPQPGLHHRFQRGQTYAIASRDGEPLRFAIETGVIAGFRDKADGRWTVAALDGKEIGRGKLPQDGEDHPVEVAVPGAGVYRLSYDDTSAGWALKTEPGVPVSLEIERGKRILSLGQFREPVFFFVPRETRELHLFWDGGNLKPKVFAPDGKLAAEIAVRGNYVTIPVPAGMDGKAWWFRSFAPKFVWFANAPNVFSHTPSALLLPKDALE
ncbi:MAG: DUF4838 domain-containing protein [Akkermansiaceae bacterium]|nr:DUF4838 domain-containing protein [Akkermansiaceae bacterium]